MKITIGWVYIILCTNIVNT